MKILYLGSREGTISDEIRTDETIARMSEVIAAQTLPVSLVVTGDDLSKKSLYIIITDD
jgi:hypothetical protein